MCKNNNLKVESLERYGKSITDIPKNAFKGQTMAIFNVFKKKFGILGLIPFFINVLIERKKLIKKYSKQYRELKKLTPAGAAEMTGMISIFNTIAKKESRENAYNFIKTIFQQIAKNSMSALYQLDDLEKCSGDKFTNYKKMNIAMFKASERDFKIKSIEEDENHLRIVIDRCLNVDAAKMFECPEVAMLGCDHDLAAYPVIEKRVDSIFRRPCTIAKGDCTCDFNFYRMGFEPKGPFVNK